MDLITIQNDKPILKPETASKIAEFERQAKAIEAKSKALRAEIQKEMEALGLIKIETDDLLISYVAPYDKENFDKKTFKDENPLLYDEYVTMTRAKASVRIKLKEAKK